MCLIDKLNFVRNTEADHRAFSFNVPAEQHFWGSISDNTEASVPSKGRRFPVLWAGDWMGHQTPDVEATPNVNNSASKWRVVASFLDQEPNKELNSINMTIYVSQFSC